MVYTISDYSVLSYRHIIHNMDIPNDLHEFQIITIDLQTPVIKRPYDINQDELGQEILWRANYPEDIFGPRPLTMRRLDREARDDSFRIIFASRESSQMYRGYGVRSRNDNVKVMDERVSLYESIAATVEDKQGEITVTASVRCPAIAELF